VAIGWGLFDDEVINLFQVLAVIVIIAGIWMINSVNKPAEEIIDK
jgi:multidrug transporter EmrE-like cation transporter